jgi:hypothetical protein
MKTKFTETVSSVTATYPCLRRHKTEDFVVLFISEHEGIVVESNSDHYPVNHSNGVWLSANNKVQWDKVTGTVIFDID